MVVLSALAKNRLEPPDTLGTLLRLYLSCPPRSLCASSPAASLLRSFRFTLGLRFLRFSASVVPLPSGSLLPRVPLIPPLSRVSRLCQVRPLFSFSWCSFVAWFVAFLRFGLRQLVVPLPAAPHPPPPARAAGCALQLTLLCRPCAPPPPHLPGLARNQPSAARFGIKPPPPPPPRAWPVTPPPSVLGGKL